LGHDMYGFVVMMGCFTGEDFGEITIGMSE
jgi:hypothetical protein